MQLHYHHKCYLRKGNFYRYFYVVLFKKRKLLSLFLCTRKEECMKHVFLLKSEGTTHSFLPTIHKIMKGYDYDIHISQYPNHVYVYMQLVEMAL